MRSEEKAFIFALILGFLIGIAGGGVAATGFWKGAIIEKGYAQYNPITQDFEWKEDLNKAKGEVK